MFECLIAYFWFIFEDSHSFVLDNFPNSAINDDICWSLKHSICFQLHDHTVLNSLDASLLELDQWHAIRLYDYVTIRMYQYVEVFTRWFIIYHTQHESDKQYMQQIMRCSIVATLKSLHKMTIHYRVMHWQISIHKNHFVTGYAGILAWSLGWQMAIQDNGWGRWQFRWVLLVCAVHSVLADGLDSVQWWGSFMVKSCNASIGTRLKIVSILNQ